MTQTYSKERFRDAETCKIKGNFRRRTRSDLEAFSWLKGKLKLKSWLIKESSDLLIIYTPNYLNIESMFRKLQISLWSLWPGPRLGETPGDSGGWRTAGAPRRCWTQACVGCLLAGGNWQAPQTLKDTLKTEAVLEGGKEKQWWIRNNN